MGTPEEFTSHEPWEMDASVAYNRVQPCMPKRNTMHASVEISVDACVDALMVSHVAGTPDGGVTVGDTVAYGSPHKVGELQLLFYVSGGACGFVEEWPDIGVDGESARYAIRHTVPQR